MFRFFFSEFLSQGLRGSGDFRVRRVWRVLKRVSGFPESPIPLSCGT